MFTNFPFFKQHDQKDCGPTCLKMILKKHKKKISIDKIRDLCKIDREGVNLLGLTHAAQKFGLETLPTQITIDDLENVDLPAILHWNKNHFVVLYKIKNKKYYIADPAIGRICISRKTFSEKWLRKQEEVGTVLLLEPTSELSLLKDHHEPINWFILFKYISEHKQLIYQLMLGLLLLSALQIAGPFLTQAIVDVSINSKSIYYATLILIGQLMVFLGISSINFIRSRILLHLSIRLNISILADFLIKLMRLPMSFFDTRLTGDILQRINDQKRIESFLANNSISTLFSIINLFILSFILIHFNKNLFYIQLVFTTIYALWIIVFLKKRRQLDYNRFSDSAINQDNMIEIINGMHEIKLNNCEQRKRWQWEDIQIKLFKNNVENLNLEQLQQFGATFINQSKNLLITYLSVKSVIDGSITLGGMMAIQFMIGQLNSPIELLLNFIQSYQTTKISVERLNEIHNISDEQSIDKSYLKDFPSDSDIIVKNLSFTYPGSGNKPVINNISFIIPNGKITAIVGLSGSGKTTLLKLLLRYYVPDSGEILIGEINQNILNLKEWRKRCGAVMQDGYIFSDTISNNIAISDDEKDLEKIRKVAADSNLNEIINDLPEGLETQIGINGKGMSQGQKQRILIARALYKRPDYIFLDEATNALDAKNEKMVMNNISEYFKKKTTVIVAHRLSTVKNADNIIVFEKGKIIEQGSHQELLKNNSTYHMLIKNQLDSN